MKTEKSEEKETQIKVEPSSEVKNEKHEKLEIHGQSEVQVKIEPDEEKPQTSGFPDFGHRGPGAYTSVASLERDRSEDIESDDDVAFFRCCPHHERTKTKGSTRKVRSRS